MAIAIFAAASGARAADDPRTKANTSRAAREEALRAIPFNRLTAEARAKATDVIQDLSLYRRLPTRSIDCDPELYAFLVRHPEVVVNIWRVMGITQMQLDRVDATNYKVADGQGTKGRMEYLYSSAGVNVIYSQGTYDGPLYPRTVRGKCLILLRTSHRREPNGRYTVVGQLDTFLAVDNLGVEVLAKTFQPLIGKAADHNFTETANFVANLSHTSETNESGMLRLGRKLTDIDIKTRERFLELVSAVPQKYAATKLEAVSPPELVRAATQAGAQ
ncbi:MAG: hypothetical protein WD894_13220 [Pirellulales bacterium]